MPLHAGSTFSFAEALATADGQSDLAEIDRNRQNSNEPIEI